MSRFSAWCMSFVCLLTFQPSFSQVRNCAAQDFLLQQIQQDPHRQARLEAIELHIQNWSTQTSRIENRSVLTIPVVVHVIYRTDLENLSDEQILSQIEALNRDFRRLKQKPDPLWPQAADTEIEFCLAQTDPDGHPSPGITRTLTSKRAFTYTSDAIKYSKLGGKDAWPTDRYLNIWVGNLSSGLLGYGQFPGGDPVSDGVVVGYKYFGTKGTVKAPFDLGRTAVHEVGHWLNLRHIWGDGPCGTDDGVADTPEAEEPNFGCPENHVSCGSLDMAENYMDYTDDACMRLFTKGQRNRMQATLAPGGPRYSIIQQAACGNKPVTPPAAPSCDDGIQNGLETGIDCGAPGCPECPAPATCDDGIQNGAETGVDCGAPGCAVCPTCTDGVQNGQETGLDCGGSSCRPCAQAACAMPGQLQAAPYLLSYYSRLTWSEVAEASDYLVQIRREGTFNWLTFTTQEPTLTISGIRQGALYEWQVQSRCASGNSAFALGSFTGGSLKTSGKLVNQAAAPMREMQVFPNPSSGRLQIRWALDATDISVFSLEDGQAYASPEGRRINVLDALGRQIQSVHLDKGVNSQEWDLTAWPAGVYFIQLQLSDGSQLVERLVRR